MDERIEIVDCRQNIEIGIPINAYIQWAPAVGLKYLGLYGGIIAARTAGFEGGINAFAKMFRMSTRSIREYTDKMQEWGWLSKIVPSREQREEGIPTNFMIYDIPLNVPAQVLENDGPKDYKPMIEGGRIVPFPQIINPPSPPESEGEEPEVDLIPDQDDPLETEEDVEVPPAPVDLAATPSPVVKTSPATKTFHREGVIGGKRYDDDDDNSEAKSKGKSKGNLPASSLEVTILNCVRITAGDNPPPFVARGLSQVHRKKLAAKWRIDGQGPYQNPLNWWADNDPYFLIWVEEEVLLPLLKGFNKRKRDILIGHIKSGFPLFAEWRKTEATVDSYIPYASSAAYKDKTGVFYSTFNVVPGQDVGHSNVFERDGIDEAKATLIKQQVLARMRRRKDSGNDETEEIEF